MHALAIFFGWPSGQVWGNLLASLIWATPTALVTRHAWLAHRHRSRQSREELHRKVDALLDRQDS